MPYVGGVRGESPTKTQITSNDYIAIFTKGIEHPGGLYPHKITAANLMQGSAAMTANASASAAATKALAIGTDSVVQKFTFTAGSGAYTYNIDLSAVNATNGSIFMLNITIPASANPTIVVRNGLGGANIVSLNNSSGGNYDAMFVFDGTNWNRQRFVLNEL